MDKKNEPKCIQDCRNCEKHLKSCIEHRETAEDGTTILHSVTTYLNLFN